MEENDSFLSANSKEKVKWLCTAWDRWIWSEKEGDPEFLGMTLDTIFVTIFSKRMDLSPNSKDGTFPVPPIANITIIKFRCEAAIRSRRQYTQP